MGLLGSPRTYKRSLYGFLKMELQTGPSPTAAEAPARVGLILVCNWGIFWFGNLAQMVGNILEAGTLVSEKKKSVNHLNC